MINVNEDTAEIKGNVGDVLVDFIIVVIALKHTLSEHGMSDKSIRTQLTNIFELCFSQEDNKSN